MNFITGFLKICYANLTTEIKQNDADHVYELCNYITGHRNDYRVTWTLLFNTGEIVLYVRDATRTGFKGRKQNLITLSVHNGSSGFLIFAILQKPVSVTQLLGHMRYEDLSWRGKNVPLQFSSMNFIHLP